MVNPHLQALIDLASRRRLASLVYLKSVSDASSEPRLVEPYSLTQGKQDIMVRCYQVQPEEGWRYFMVHKLREVGDAGGGFEPRRKISLPDAVVDEGYGHLAHWTDSRQRYRDLVSDALADGAISRRELEALKKSIDELGLVPADIRFVHGSLYHRCLGAILEDGFVDREEVTELRLLHQLFHALGWCVGEK